MEALISAGIRLRSYNQGDHKTVCPKCSHERRNKKDPCLSVTISADDSGVWLCHHCGWKGGFLKNDNAHARRYKREKPKTFSLPDRSVENPVNQHVLGWFEKRKISFDTILAFDIYRSEQYFGDGLEGCISFPYIKDGKVVNIKHRTKDKRFKQEKGADRSLYNIDRVKQHWETTFDKTIIFVEGEMDVLSVYECGYPNVVTFPDGAPKEAKFVENDKRFAALSSHEWLFDADKVIIATDNDAAGAALQKEIVHRFGKDRCWIVQWPDLHDIPIKDANDVLVHHDKELLKEAISYAKPFPIDGLHSVKDYETEVLSIYDGNYQKPVSTGFEDLDQFYQVMPSTFCVVTGIPNHGKSNFIDQLIVNLAVQQDWKFAIFSPEHSTANHIRRLSEKFVKLPFDIGPNERMSKDQLKEAMAFLQERFFFVEADDQIPDITWLLDRIKHACFRHGINGVVIDPYNEIDARRDGNKREDEHIRDLISKCKQFCRAHHIAMWMVAHPAKMQRGADGSYPPPSLYDISGSAHWNNMADVGLVVHRDFEEDNTRVIIRKIREQGLYGSIGEVFFRFNTAKHIYQIQTQEPEYGHGIYQD